MKERAHEAGMDDFERTLQALAADDRHVRVPAHVHSTVMRVWDATMAPGRPLRAPRRSRWITLLAGTVAAGLFVAGLLVSRNPDVAPNRTHPIVAAERSHPTLNEATHNPIERVVTRPTPARRRPRATPPVRHARTARGIVLVADPVADASALNVLRVRVPRSVLVHFGIPMADPDATGSVDLEVLVGEDGIARTIRRAVPVTTSEPQE